MLKPIMATLPLEVYEVFEDKIGKEDARVIVKSIELTITHQMMDFRQNTLIEQ